jgi:nitroimidazol reductase NimA-like FMN-containing flavoprotein (pyridoxamine 5'-phosphate oxidase superfamily)
VYRILDAGFVCHVGYVIDGQPYVTATSYWRQGDRLYWHGSSASRMLRRVKEGVPVCVNVSLFDGLVLARSGFHHSINYRSVMLFGEAAALNDEREKLGALEVFTERLWPGRWAELRPTTSQELKATTVLAMPIEEAVAKERTGPPGDDEEDYDLDVWAGEIPLRLTAGRAVPDPRLKPGVLAPAYLENFDLERRR